MTTTHPDAPSVFKSREGELHYREAYDNVLQHWPIPYEELDLPTRFGWTHVIASGNKDAPALLLLPSFAGSATVWRPNIEALSQHYRTYAVDVIGQAGKSVQSRLLKNRHDFADWILDLLDALGVQRASIVGSSYGGFLAMSQALLTPDRVGHIVLISPAGTFAGGLLWVFLRGMLKRLLSPRKERDIADMLGNGATLHADDIAWGELMNITLKESARPNLISADVFTREQLATVKSPVLLLIGDQELLYNPHKTLQKALARMPALKGEIVPNAHHLAALACPDFVNPRILEFLKA